MGPPIVRSIQQNRAAQYIEALNKILSEKRLNMVLVVIPNNKSDAYAAVKKLCLLQKPTPSQCVTATVLNKWVPKGCTSVAQKVAVQMASKLGGEPWAVKIPVNGLMVIGKCL